MSAIAALWPSMNDFKDVHGRFPRDCILSDSTAREVAAELSLQSAATVEEILDQMRGDGVHILGMTVTVNK